MVSFLLVFGMCMAIAVACFIGGLGVGIERGRRGK